MSKIHGGLLYGSQGGVTLHAQMPAGNNSVGKSWKNCYLSRKNNEGSPLTSLKEGNGPFQISTVELALINSGDVIEFVETIPIQSGGTTPAQLAAAVEIMCNQKIAENIARLQTELTYYGYTAD